MNIAALVRELEHLGVRLWEEQGALRFRAPKGVLTEARRAALVAHKQALLEHLRADQVTLEAQPEARHEPFPLTDVQAAYLLGRRRGFLYGGVGCHAYGELAIAQLDVARLQRAWRHLIARHDMLRAIVLPDGTQQVLRAVPDYSLQVADLRGATAAQREQALAATRAELGHQVHDPGTWPLFDLRATLCPEHDRLHVSIDFLIADYVSIFVLLDELRQLYEQPAHALPALALSFRDCLLASRAQRAGAAYERARAYWLARADTLPPAPELPVLEGSASADESVRFQRFEFALAPPAWQEFARQASARGLTASAAVLAAYAEVVGNWSRHRQFTLDLTLLNRPPWHPDVARIVGDFTSVELLAVDQRRAGTFSERAQRLQRQLGADLEHTAFSGVELIRELARRRGAREALMPVVYTSALGLTGDGGNLPLGDFAGGISQTPQVWIDCQAMERQQRLALNWDVRLGVFPAGLVETMFATFEALVRELASGAEGWEQPCPLPLPAEQAARRAAVNDTAVSWPTSTLLDGGLAWAQREPARVALLTAHESWSYDKLWRQAGAVQSALLRRDVRPGELVAVQAAKGPAQVVGVLGVLLAGAAYLPLEASEPALRRDEILRRAGVRFALVDDDDALPAGMQAIALRALEPLEALPQAVAVRPDQLAYVIYTSGSTGQPKGVMITHAQASNTIHDINRRFQVGAAERVLCVSSLAFDLSVYDIFGLLAVGGALVLPSPERRGDPSHWAELVASHGVTLWNSVPGLLGLLLDYAGQREDVDLRSLRLVLLSGDWVPIELVRRLRARLPGSLGHALGGATEGSIWSLTFPLAELPPNATFVPYGRALANQSLHVLDAGLHPRPEGVVGEICIGGAGVALGYWGDPVRSAERFMCAPGGGRLYRTGDLGRCHADGTIEILGREDAQVKIRGQRVELGEIEATLATHTDVARAAVVVTAAGTEPRRVLAFVEAATLATPPTPALALASSASIELPDGATPAALATYARALDRAALAAMLAALREAGLFGAGHTHAPDDVLSALGVAPRQRRLVRRFLRALLDHGYLELVETDPPPARYRASARAEQLEFAPAWEAIERLPVRFDSPVLLDYFRTSGARLTALLRDEASALELLYPQGRPDVSMSLNEQSLFNRWGHAVVADLAARIAANLPVEHDLRVLEVGGGLGGTTAAVLAKLGRACDYCFTDIGTYFLNAARTRFADVAGWRAQPYDLNQPSREQGFTPNSFDLVIAGDVLHVARNVPQALADLRELLAPGGWLVALEMTRDHAQIMTSLELLNAGATEGAGYTDERAERDQTFFARADWLRLLAASQAEPVEVLPADSDPFAELGLCVFAARYKAARVPLRPAALATFLRARLPEAMLPAEIQVLDQLPSTVNGKLDRQRLATWETRAVRAQSMQPALESDLERRLGTLWSAVLGGIAPARDQDFFGAGGDSLLAAQLAGRVLEELPEARALFFDDLLRLILQGPTLAGLAQAVASGLESQAATPDATAAAEWNELGGDRALPACLLLHDGSAGTSGLRRLAEALTTRLHTFEVLAAAAPEQLAEQAARCQARLDDAALRDVHLVGLGTGNLLALELARHLLDVGQDPGSVTVTSLDGQGASAPGPAGLRYAGDLTLIQPAGDEAGADYWRTVCLGDLRLLALSDPQPETLARLIVEACGA
jgi:pyochelin synthetase